MRSPHIYTSLFSCIAVVAVLCTPNSTAWAQSGSIPGNGSNKSMCKSNDSGLKLPAGFCATVFADEIGHARHLAVAANGAVYVNTWSGDYYDFDKPHDGGFLVALQD